jgi:hypothetical protein
VQEAIREMQGFSAAVNGVNAARLELPKAPVLVGVSLVGSPTGFDLQVTVPNEIGPVVEGAMGIGQGK